MLLASQRINISCENIAYLGDAQRDMDAANDVKMLSVLALWGYIDALDKIELWQADLAFETATKFKQALLAN